MCDLPRTHTDRENCETWMARTITPIYHNNGQGVSQYPSLPRPRALRARSGLAPPVPGRSNRTGHFHWEASLLLRAAGSGMECISGIGSGRIDVVEESKRRGGNEIRNIA
jgi:hypothetical protein